MKHTLPLNAPPGAAPGQAARRGLCRTLLGWVGPMAVAWGAVAAPPAQPPSTLRAPPCPTAAAARLPALQRLAPQLWWLPGAVAPASALDAGDADAANRGRVANLLIARQGRRLWLLGSGPTAAAGAALDCALRQRLGQAATDVIAPWPHPELVLGQAGLPRAQTWAHADVARTMRNRCPRCVERLRQRLDGAAADLGADPVRLPARTFTGDHGRLGPWHWWRLWRSKGTGGVTAVGSPASDATPVTVWWHPASGVFSAHGLLWADQAPDLRDAAAPDVVAAWQALQGLADEVAGPGAAVGPSARRPPLRWLPEQGPLLLPDAPALQLAYDQALSAAVRRAQAAGADETAPAQPLDGVPAWMQTGGRHALNWQRRWRELEPEGFDTPAPR